ncbi:hypothetical protein KPH14_011934 [Odynerus spinipes]|uniref:Uncharacterized protein n=1 Tax=Odynerus spinipes TaxID=1348599 RepID=A0AAD9RCL9_9HYME|nr:hypothetical protein KPH14_011934 [Odynerus spinipes]
MPQNEISKRKPKYVKRLNFGQSILNLNVVDRPSIFSGNRLIIDKNVAQVPTTEKEDFVRQWIETHNYDIDVSSNGSNQSSPVLGISKFKQTETSHICGIGKHRKRVRSKLDDNLMKMEVHKQVEMSPVLGSLKRKNRRQLSLSAEKKQMKIYMNDRVSVQRSPLSENSRIDNLQNVKLDRSPILVRDMYCYKRKRRKVNIENHEAQKLHTVTMKRDDNIDKNMNLLPPLSTSKDRHSLSPEISSSVTERIKNDRNNQILEIKKNAIVRSPSPLITGKNVIIENNSKHKTSFVIESVSSDDSNTKEYKEIVDANSSSDETVSNIIEDIDTQETDPLVKTAILGANNKWTAASSRGSDETSYSKAELTQNKTSSRMKNKWILASPKDSDETFVSKAKSIPSNYSLDKISQVTAFSNESADCGSSQINLVISNVTSPVRTNSWPAMSLQIIDSCKKKRRVKKKSLAGKLQSLISRQTSFVRMWHHQMKQANIDGISMPHVVVYVDKCTVHFYRQFLEGIVLDDPFNLLNDNESNEEYKMSESTSTKLLNKIITVIVIPDIVGKIEMRSESIVKIYPPWDIMDNSKMILNVTYIKIISNDQRNLILSKIKIPNRRKEKELIKEFHCKCLEADKILCSCKKRSNHAKPDVMEELFKL